MQAAFRARLDDEALLVRKARRKTQTWTWPAPENRVAPYTLRVTWEDGAEFEGFVPAAFPFVGFSIII